MSREDLWLRRGSCRARCLIAKIEGEHEDCVGIHASEAGVRVSLRRSVSRQRSNGSIAPIAEQSSETERPTPSSDDDTGASLARPPLDTCRPLGPPAGASRQRASAARERWCARPRRVAVFAVMARATPGSTQSVAAPCATLWLDLTRDGQACSSHERSRPLAHFLRFAPLWRESAARIEWDAVSETPRVTRVGAVGRAFVYRMTYGRQFEVYVSQGSDASFRPLLILEGDDDGSAIIYDPERVSASLQELYHVRVQAAGTGNLQVSVFLTPYAGSVAAVRPALRPVEDWLRDRGLALYHRGGGFCKGRLEFRSGVEYAASGVGAPLDVVALFALREGRIRPVRIRLVPAEDSDAPDSCDVYPH